MQSIARVRLLQLYDSPSVKHGESDDKSMKVRVRESHPARAGKRRTKQECYGQDLLIIKERQRACIGNP